MTADKGKTVFPCDHGPVADDPALSAARIDNDRFFCDKPAHALHIFKRRLRVQADHQKVALRDVVLGQLGLHVAVKNGIFESRAGTVVRQHPFARFSVRFGKRPSYQSEARDTDGHFSTSLIVLTFSESFAYSSGVID